MECLIQTINVKLCSHFGIFPRFPFSVGLTRTFWANSKIDWMVGLSSKRVCKSSHPNSHCFIACLSYGSNSQFLNFPNHSQYILFPIELSPSSLLQMLFCPTWKGKISGDAHVFFPLINTSPNTKQLEPVFDYVFSL